MLKQLKKQKSEGFTIIEVMIVLAIAGLILLIVFLAVPALQRNSRNTQRKNDASHVASLISEWESNNAGATPSGVVFSGTVSGTQIDATKEKFSIIDTSTNISISAFSGTPATPAADSVVVYTKATCTGNAATAGTSNRQIAVWYGLEGGTSSGCIVAG